MTPPKGGLSVSVELDQKALARADKRLQQYMGKPLQTRARRAYLEGAKLMVTPMRRKARGMFKDRHERAQRTVSTIKARTPRMRPGELAVASVGPTTGLRHIIVRGTKAHSLAPKRADAGPWVAIPIDARGAGGFGPRRVRVVPGALVRHPGGSPRPFVDATYREMGDRVQDFIASRVVGMTGDRSFRPF